MHPILKLRYAERAAHHRNPAAKALLETMERKKSNLCVSVDVIEKSNFLAIVDAVGPYFRHQLTLHLDRFCSLRNVFPYRQTHIDIIEDFDHDLIDQLQCLSRKHGFLLFEDRKFADIGNTVALQYAGGVHRIASWAHITNAHPVPGPSVVDGLASIGVPLNRGLLLLAEMSSKGSLAHGSYTEEAVLMAQFRRDFVFGFVAQRRMEHIGFPSDKYETDDEGKQHCEDNQDFLILTPGVALEASGDALGQQYRTPRAVVLEEGCDMIIVGRGIYGRSDKVDVVSAQSLAERYRQEGWAAYEDRLRQFVR